MKLFAKTMQRASVIAAWTAALITVTVLAVGLFRHDGVEVRLWSFRAQELVAERCAFVTQNVTQFCDSADRPRANIA
jgi:hypothetical protein